MRYYRYILGTFEVSLVHRWYINVPSLYRFQAQKRCVIYSFIHVPILYQIGHISDIFGNPVQNRYTFFVPVKMYQFCTFFRCGQSSSQNSLQKKEKNQSSAGQGSGRRSHSGKASSFEKHGKGSDDPIKMANKFDGLEDGMDFS